MAQDREPAPTLDGLRRCSLAFREVIDRLDEHRSSQHRDEQPYTAGSLASLDAASETLTALVDDLLGLVNLRAAAALDLSDTLIGIAETAVSGAPAATYAPWPISRSVVEYLAVAHWLVTDRIDAAARAARALSIQYQEARGQLAVTDDARAFITEIADEAQQLGLKKAGKGSRRGFGRELPSRTEMVRATVADSNAYAILSAASHGETWALFELGYTRDGSSPDPAWGIQVQKKPPVSVLVLALRYSMRANTRFAIAEAEYRGWDVEALRSMLEAAYHAQAIPPDGSTSRHGTSNHAN